MAEGQTNSGDHWVTDREVPGIPKVRIWNSSIAAYLFSNSYIIIGNSVPLLALFFFPGEDQSPKCFPKVSKMSCITLPGQGCWEDVHTRTDSCPDSTCLTSIPIIVRHGKEDKCCSGLNYVAGPLRRNELSWARLTCEMCFFTWTHSHHLVWPCGCQRQSDIQHCRWALVGARGGAPLASNNTPGL